MTEEKDKTVYRRQADAQTPSKRRNKKKLRKLPYHFDYIDIANRSYYLYCPWLS